MKSFFSFLFFFITSFLFAQSIENKSQLEKVSWFNQVEFKNIGPTIMSGRVVDIAVNPTNSSEFYVAYATGGLWYTNNNGNTFEPVLDTAPTLNCGTVTVDWKSGTIWVGTGEINASRSSYAGLGVLRSRDKGKTWENIGLQDSHHISKIIVNPDDINEIVLGVVGHLYTSNQERGVYKTFDGGKTWKKALFVDQESGVIDMAYAPNNFKIQYASVWKKDRKAWNFSGNGSTSSIYKSTDGGLTWVCLTTGQNDFPHNDGVGRIGLAVFDENTVYAVLDNQNKRVATKVQETTDANKAMFDTNVTGCELYKTQDGGKNWVKTNTNYIDDMYYTYGYYFGNIAVDPKNKDKVIIGGVPVLLSEDGGKTFVNVDKENVHSDHHYIWIDPLNTNHIINGNDGGVNISYDNGSTWNKCNNQAVGQFYAVNVDEQEPYHVYGGLQDNGVWVGPNDYSHDMEWQQNGKYPYESLSGGDGMQVQIDKRNPNIIITGSQYGNYARIDRIKKTEKKITPRAKKGEEAYRYNWQTPILLSPHNQDILYMGSNFLHRSMNQGSTWEIISPDLTKGKKEGNVPFGTLTTISESPFQFGLLYVGTDDGLVEISKDGGFSWAIISKSLPQNFWVSRIVASAYKKERVYVALNGYRNDDFTTMVYVSDDYGVNWKNIASNIPSGSVNIIMEDNKNENILYLGTDNGLYVSLNSGNSWQDFSNGIPNVPIHDLVIQKKENDLIVATHGRSLYKVNLETIQSLTAENQKKELLLYEVKPINKAEYWGKSFNAWEKPYEPKQEIWFYSNASQKVNMIFRNPFNQVVFSKDIEAIIGLNKIVYDLTITNDVVQSWQKKDPKLKIEKAKNGKYYLPASKIKITITNGNVSSETELLLSQKKENAFENKQEDEG